MIRMNIILKNNGPIMRRTLKGKKESKDVEKK